MKVIHTPTQLVSFLVWNTSKEVQKDMDDMLKHFDLTYVQFLILYTTKRLNTVTKFVTQKDISEYLSTDKNVISQCLKRLEKKVYIQKGVHPIDTRAKVVILTKQGEKRLLQTEKLLVLKDRYYLGKKISKSDKFEEQLQLMIG